MGSSGQNVLRFFLLFGKNYYFIKKLSFLINYLFGSVFQTSVVRGLTLYQIEFFGLLEPTGGLIGQRQKNCYKTFLLHPIRLKPGAIHLWTFTKILSLVTWSKLSRHHSVTNFFYLTFIFFLCLNSTVSFWKLLT